MKSIFFKNRNQGIGLIEVLVTTVVVAAGLLAVASMQGGFMSGSASNKARAEALVLAEQKMEELRNYINPAQFPAVATSTDPVITGTNAAFTRSWEISAITVAPVTTTRRVAVTVTVTWDCNRSVAGDCDQKRVAVSSQIAYVEPSNTAGLASGSGEASHPAGLGMTAPSPNVRASARTQDIVKILDGTQVKAEFTLVSGNLYQKANGDIYRLDGGGSQSGRKVEYIVNLTPFDIDLRFNDNNAIPPPASAIRLYTKRLNLDTATIQLYTANVVGGIGDGANKFNETVANLTLDGTASQAHGFYGGVILSVKGTVYTTTNLNTIKVDHNREDMYCVFNPGVGKQSRDYACYAGGNCNNSISGAGHLTTIPTTPSVTNDATQCPGAVADAKVGPGGWRGNVGLINIDDEDRGKESVCYLEEINATTSDPTTARKYKGMFGTVEQGINESYSCQNYLIVGRAANFSQLAEDCKKAIADLAITGLAITGLPPKAVVRTISGLNTVVGIYTSHCDNLP